MVASGAPSIVAAQALMPMAEPPASRSASIASPSLVFDDVTVVDVQTGRIVPAQRVVIAGQRIQAVGDRRAVRLPINASIVRARGKYLIPGLWDMHVHIDLPGGDDIAVQDSLYRATYPRFIAYGVTGIREMAQRFPHGADSFRVWQRDVLAGHRVGPRAVGPSADVTFGNRIEIATPEDARRIVDSLKAAGDAFVKFHDDHLEDPALFFALARAARRVGLPLVGHVSMLAGNVAVADSGLRSIEHVEEHHECLRDWSTKDREQLDSPTLTMSDSAAVSARCVPVAQAYIRNGTWLTPTLAAAHWIRRQVYDAQQFVRLLHRLGVRKFLVGTDYATTMGIIAMPPRFLPGASVIEEMTWLATAGGLTPLEVLQAATLNPAKFFDATDTLGAVAAGKLADLVLLDANPLTDITNVSRVWAVLANGRYFDRAALDRLDPEGAPIAQRNMDEIRMYGQVRAASLGLEGSRRSGRGGAELVNQGMVIDRVTPDGAADVAGLVPGDVIAAVDGEPVAEPQRLRLLVMRQTPGDRMTIDVIRQSGTRERIDVILGEECDPGCP